MVLFYTTISANLLANTALKTKRHTSLVYYLEKKS